MITCSYCNKEFEKKKCNQKFCSRQHQIQFNNKKYRENHREKSNNYWQKYNAKEYPRLKNNVFNLFGNACNSCGINDPDILCIDHIDHVGKNRKRITYPLYRWILNHPTESKTKFQLLCRNCNWKKRIINNEGIIKWKQ